MNILFKQSNNGHRKAINVNYKTLYFAKKSTANVVIYRLNTIQKTFSFLASLLNDHVSPSRRGKEDNTMSGIPWVIQEKVFTDLESKLPPQIGDIKLLILKRHSVKQENPSLRGGGGWSTDARLVKEQSYNLLKVCRKRIDQVFALKVGKDTEFRTSRSREFQSVIADGRKDFWNVEVLQRSWVKFTLDLRRKWVRSFDSLGNISVK